MSEETAKVPDLQDLLAGGLRHHQAGHLAQAELCYRQILQVDSRHADALHLLGLIAYQVGQNDAAVQLMRSAIEIVGNEAAFYSNLGNALIDLGRPVDGIAAYRAALCIWPHQAATYANLGLALKGQKNMESAVLACRAAFRINPDQLDACAKLGNLLYDLRRLDDAVAAYRVLLLCQPDNAESHYNHGLALYRLGRLDEAVASYRTAVQLKPDFADGLSNLGVALKELGRLSEAVMVYGAALRIKPTFAATHSNLGNALKELGCLKQAVDAYRAALCLQPDFADALTNLGNALRELGYSNKAVMAFDAALHVKPDHAHSHYNRGNALKDLARLDEAVAAYNAALRINPDYVEAHANMGIALLLMGQLESGWRHYEWRWRAREFAAVYRDFPQPQWQGEWLEGKTILLHAEQGLGDAVQFCRYAPMVAAKRGRVILEVPRTLLGLLANLPGVDELVAAGDPLPAFDLHCPLMSLPGLFGTNLDRVPPVIPVTADPGRVTEWQKRLRSPHCNIGIVWQGNRHHQADRDRSVPLALFAVLAKVPGMNFISLQKGYGVDQIDYCSGMLRLVRLGPDYDAGDFMETASVLSALDLVITIDSAVAHLAGTLCVPIWVLLPFVPDWRWLLDRDDTPWYPTMRLFRQKSAGDWQGVFERMAVDLRSMIQL